MTATNLGSLLILLERKVPIQNVGSLRAEAISRLSLMSTAVSPACETVPGPSRVLAEYLLSNSPAWLGSH